MNEQQAAAGSPAPDLSTIREVAARVRLSYVGALGLVHRGLLPVTKVGKAYRVRAVDLERVLEPTTGAGRR